MTDRQTYKSLLHEMSSFMPVKNKEEIIEARAQHIMVSAINLLQTIHENFDAEEAELLEKRFFNSIKNNDIDKFNRHIRKLKESKNANSK